MWFDPAPARTPFREKVEMVRLGGLPFRPSEFPVLDEYGVTLQQAEAAETDALKEINAAHKAGKLTEFAGTL